LREFRFVWDSDKARSNLTKHGVSFETAQQVFAEPLALMMPDRIVDGEERWHILGTPDPAGFALILVVHTLKDATEETIRLISARRATSKERSAYEKENR
jgi:uncharacterized DUF497 family protein